MGTAVGLAVADEAAADGHAMIALWPAMDVAGVLAVDGGEPAESLHVTLVYLGQGADRPSRDLVEMVLPSFAAAHQVVEGRFNGVGRWESEEHGDAPHVYLLDAPTLARLREDLVAALEAEGVQIPATHGFTPHLTVAYVPDGAKPPVLEPPGVDVTFGEIWLSWGEEKLRYRLQPAATPEAVTAAAEWTYVEAPDPWPEEGPRLFLAGGITGCPDWQTEAVAMLAGLPAVVLNPRRADFPMDDPTAAEEQIRWEHDALAAADAVLFWFPAESDCPIALYELGAWSATDKPLFVGTDPEYPRRVDVMVQTLLARPDLVVQQSLAETVAEAAAVLTGPPAPAWEALVVTEGMETIDRRNIVPATVEIRAQDRLPVMWKRHTGGDGHDGAVRVATAESVMLDGATLLMAGSYLDTDEGRAFAAAVVRGEAGWPSVDIADPRVVVTVGDDGREVELYEGGVYTGFTVCQIQAQDGTFIRPASAALVAHGLDEDPLAAPPRSWFDDPQLDDLTPMTVDPDGRVYGHPAGPGCFNGDEARCLLAPTGCDYDAWFHLGARPVDDGGHVNVGNVALGHPARFAALEAVRRWYSDPRLVRADVRCGEDAQGRTWMAGALRPGLSAAERVQMSAAKASGHWEWKQGRYQLVAVGLVNIPGYPVPRPEATFIGDEPQRLVAAGIVDGNHSCPSCEEAEDLIALDFRVSGAPLADLDGRVELAALDGRVG